LTTDEYDRIQRFLRLWRKLGWTIDETDQALIGLGTSPATIGTTPATPATPATGGTTTPAPSTPGCQYVGFDVFSEDCTPPAGANTSDGPTPSSTPSSTPYVSPPVVDPAQILSQFPKFLHELAVVHKLLDLTGLPLAKLLTFWADINTVGEKSLY